jgi:hypothetical protein
VSAGQGATGHRYYDWALVAITDGDPTGHQHLVIRRNRTTGELAYNRCYSARPVPLSTLVRVAASRWTVEETFQSSKGLAGLDEHQVRRWDSWHRWVTLALLAHAFLAITAAHELRDQAPTDDGTSPDGLVPLTCNEIQRLFTARTVRSARDTAHRLRWSTWRRRHQARARRSHYRRCRGSAVTVIRPAGTRLRRPARPLAGHCHIVRSECPSFVFSRSVSVGQELRHCGDSSECGALGDDLWCFVGVFSSCVCQ